MTETTRPQVVSAPAGTHRPSLVWPDGIEERSPWPQRTAVLLADERYEEAVDVLRRMNFATVQVRRGVDPRLLDDIDPFAFVLVGSEALAEQQGDDLLVALRRLSPVARVLLLAGDPEPAVLVAGIRAGAQEVVDPLDQSALLAVLRTELRKAGHGRERVLAIGAHPDDVEIGCAGTLLQHRRHGDRITILTLSRGAVGGTAGSRVEEAAAAAAMIGAQLLLADLPDTRVSEGIDTIRLIEQVAATTAPTVVYVHSAHDNHQDHRAVHTATLSATRAVPTLMAYQSPSANNRFLPSAFVPIDRVMDRKLDVLANHASQVGRSYLEAEAVTSAARYWARHLASQARYAEPFELVRAITRISDTSPE
jgi:LmbE family N-acetylglucosaminyl deacetylase